MGFCSPTIVYTGPFGPPNARIERTGVSPVSTLKSPHYESPVPSHRRSSPTTVPAAAADADGSKGLGSTKKKAEGPTASASDGPVPALAASCSGLLPPAAAYPPRPSFLARRAARQSAGSLFVSAESNRKGGRLSTIRIPTTAPAAADADESKVSGLPPSSSRLLHLPAFTSYAVATSGRNASAASVAAGSLPHARIPYCLSS
jgi:hypothetical protein